MDKHAIKKPQCLTVAELGEACHRAKSKWAVVAIMWKWWRQQRVACWSSVKAISRQVKETAVRLAPADTKPTLRQYGTRTRRWSPANTTQPHIGLVKTRRSPEALGEPMPGQCQGSRRSRNAA
jgi:hypothetical protein